MPRLDELVDPSAFDAQFSGQPLPDETGEQFLERRKKLGDLGALGPERLAQGPRDRAQLNDDAARVRGDLAQNAQRDAIEAQRRTDAAAKEAQRRTDAEAKAAQTAANAAAKAAQAAQLKQMREAGIVLKTDDTGATVPDTHEDGRVKYKADMIGDPYIDEQTGRPVRKYRDEYGSTSTVDLEQNGDLHTDAQTGSRYYKSPSGLRVDLGPDEHWQKREAVKADLDRLKTEEELARVELDQHQLATAPLKEKWKEQEKATKELRDKLEEAEGLEKSMGAMLPDASKESIKRLRAQWEQVKPGYEAAKAELDAATEREREISGGILEKKKRAIEIAADLDKLKARSWGAKADVPRIEDRAKSAVEQAQSELKAAQDEARTLAASSKLATTATAGGMTEEQAAALTASAGAAGKAVNEKIKAAAAKVAHLNKLAGTLAETTAKLESTVKEANARMGAIRKESQIVAADVMLGKLPAEQGRAKLDALDKAMEQARKPVETIEQQRKGAITQIATAFDDPQKWEQSPERGLALAEVERKIAEAQESGTTATEAALDTLKKAPTDMVEGQPVEAQIATLKAELERRNAKTPRAEYTEQIAMLDTALKAKKTTEQNEALIKNHAATLVAQRNAETAKSWGNWGDGVFDGAARVWNEQVKSVGDVWANKDTSTAVKVLNHAGGNLGAVFGTIGTVLSGKTLADLTRQALAQEARQMIGNLDAAGAEKVIRDMPRLDELWKKNGSVLNESQKQQASDEGDARFFSPGAEGNFRFIGGGKSNNAAIALNRTLYGAEKLIKELEAEKPGAIGDAALSAMAAALPFVSSGQIEIDENDTEQVAQRAFLRVKLYEAIEKHAPGTSIAGSAVGSMLAFMAAGGAARGVASKLGGAARAKTLGTGAIMGADMSLKENDGNIGLINRLSDIAFKGIVLMGSERLGDRYIGDPLQARIAGSAKIPEWAGKFSGRMIGTAAGEQGSDIASNAMEGKNAFEDFWKTGIPNLGLGVGAAIVGLFADGRSKNRGGKLAAGPWEGAMQAHNDARAELDAAEQRADAAAIAIAQDKVKATDAALSAMTSQLANVGDATRRGLSAALGAETAAIFPALEENPVLGDAAAAIGAEVRDAYLPGARGEAAAKIVANDPDFAGSNLGDIVINRAIGAMVARDLAAVAEGRANLTPEKKAALVRLGLIEDRGEIPSAITDSGVALLPSAMRKAILADPGKFGVVATAGSDGRIINGLIAQARDQINTRVTGTTAKQAAAVAAAVQAAANAAPVPQAATKPVFVVVINPDGKEGKDRRTWKIEADNASEAESIGRARAAMLKLGVKAATVKPLKGNPNPSANSQSPKSKSETTPKAKEAPKAAPAKQPTFRVEVTTTGKEGTGTLTWEIEADDAAGAEKSARARAAKMKKKVQGIKVTPLSSVDAGGGPQSEENAFIAPSEPVAGAGSGSSDENTTPPAGEVGSGQSAAGSGAVETPETPKETKPEAKPKAEKPKKEKKPKAEASPTQQLRTAIGETIGKVLASGKMAKSFGALGVKINRDAKMPPVKKNADGTISGAWIHAGLEVDGQGNPVYSLDFNVDRAVLLLESRGMSPKDAADYVEASLREELIHFAQYQAIYERWALDGKKGPFMQAIKAHYAALWKELTPEQQKAVRELHGLSFEPWAMSAEGVRMIVQLSLDGKTTTTLTEKLKALLRDALDVLQRLAGNPAAQSEHLARTVEDVKQMLARLEAADSGQSAVGSGQAAMARMAALGLVENIEGRIRKGKTDAEIAAALQIKDVEGVAAVRAAMKPETPAEEQGRGGSDADRVEKTFEKVIDSAWGQILESIQSGEIPDTVGSFEELQNATDANLYVNNPIIGELGKSLGWKNTDYIEFTNRLIKKLDEMLKVYARPAFQKTPKDNALSVKPESEGVKKARKLFDGLAADVPRADVVRDWDAFGESLRDELDSFNPARDSGRRNYDLDDMVDRFVAFAREDTTGRPLEKLASEFGKIDEASTSQLRKLHAAIKSVSNTNGLAADTPRATFEQVPLPAERMAAAADAAATLYTEGVRTPEDMVKTLVQIGEDTGRDLRKYARAFWRFFQGVDFNLQENPDWQAVFDGLSGGNTETRAEAQGRGEGDGVRETDFVESGKESPGPVNNAETRAENKVASPLQRDWSALKAQHPDKLLAVRIGDFIEFFNDDAKTAAGILNVTITNRQGVPMAGIPVHSQDRYFKTLAESGQSIALAHTDDAGKRQIVQVFPAENQNTQEPKEYAYGMHMRPLQIGAQPKGYTRADQNDKRGRHGVIYYNRPLTADEIADFELKDLNTEQGNKPAQDPNIGREWDSVWGRQRIISVTPDRGSGSGPMYTVATVGTDTVRNYTDYKGSLEETIKRQEYELTPEYAAEKAEQAKRKAADEERARAKAEEAAALQKEISDFGAAVKLSKLETGKAQKALMVEVARDIDGARADGPRAKVVKALVAAGYAAKQKDKEWRLHRESDGRFYVVTKTEAMFADWVAGKTSAPVPVETTTKEQTSQAGPIRTTPREGTSEREALKAKSKAFDAQIEAISIEIDALRAKRKKTKNLAQGANMETAINRAEDRREQIRSAATKTRIELRKAILEDVIEGDEEINAAFALEELTGEKNAELFDRAKAIAVEAFKAAGFNDQDAGFYGTDVVSSVASTFAVKDRAFSKYLAFSVDMKTRQRTIAEARKRIEEMAGPDDAPRRQFLVQLQSAESRGDVEEANAIVERAMKFRDASAAVAKEQAPDPQPTSLRGDAKQVSGSAAAAEASTKGKNTEPKVMKAQKQFLAEALSEAIAEAPEDIDPAQPKHIKIAVPNDGTFFLVNTKAVLKQFAERVNKSGAFSRKWVSATSGERLKETDTGATPFVTSGFPTGPQADDSPKAPKIPSQSEIPKIGKPKNLEEWVKITEPFRGKEQTRAPLMGSYGDGSRVFASDGRVAISVRADNTGKKDALAAFGSPKEKMTVATLDGLKAMFSRKGNAVAKGVDTEQLWSMLKAAQQAAVERFEGVRLWLNPDHSIGLSLWGNPDTQIDTGAYYAGNMQDNATEIGMFNVDYLTSIVGAVRAAGSEFLTISRDQDVQFNPPFHFTDDAGNIHALLMQVRSDMTAEQEIEEMARRGVAGLTPEQRQEIATRAEELLRVRLSTLHPRDYIDHFEALNELRMKIPASMSDMQYLAARESDKLKDMVFNLLSDGTKFSWSQFASRKADDPAKINMLVGVREQLAKASRPPEPEAMPRKDATQAKSEPMPAAPVEEKKAPDPLRRMSAADRAEAVRLGTAIHTQEAMLDVEWITNLKVRGAIDDPKWDIVMSAQIRRAKLQELLWENGFDSIDNLTSEVYEALGLKSYSPHLATGIQLDALRDISDYAAEGNKAKLDQFKVSNPVESYHWEKFLSKGIALDADALALYNDSEAATFAQRFYADSAGSAEKTIRAMYDRDAYEAAEAWIDDHLDRSIDQHIESTQWTDDEENLGVGWSDYSGEIPVFRFQDGKYYTFTRLEMVDGQKVIRIKEIAPRQIVIRKDSPDKTLAAKKSADRKAWIAGGNDREIAPGYKPSTTSGLFDVAKKAKDYTAKIAHARRLLEKIDTLLESEDTSGDRIGVLEGRAAELEKQITDWQRGLVEAQLDRQRREAIAKASASMDAAREANKSPETPPVNINARHTVQVEDAITPAGTLKAAFIGNAASDVWHHQGDINHTYFTDRATIGGKSGSTEQTRRTIAEYEAAKKDGWSLVNKRAGSYGTLYVFQKDKELLTNSGAAALATGKFAAPVVENKAGYDELVRAQTEYARPFVTWMLTLPESTLESASAFGTKLSTTAIGKWVSTDQDNTKEGYNFWFHKDGRRHIGVSGESREAAMMKLIALAMPDNGETPTWKRGENPGWKTIGEALDAYAAATGRVRTGLVDPMSPPTDATETPQATTLIGARKFLTALLEGEVTAAQVKEQWQAFKAAKDQIVADMMALKKDDLIRLAGIRASKSDTKEQLARSAWDSLMSVFNPTDSLSFSIGRDMETSRLAAMERVVATWTDEMIQQKAEARKAAMAERERAAKAPETADEWEQFVYNRGRQKPTAAELAEFKKLKGRAQFHYLMARGEKMLTPEELAAYDAVRAKEAKQSTQDAAERKAVIQGVEAKIETQIVETKHTQKGHDLFVVKLGDRVERGIYDRLNVAAKKLGGYYSSFKGAGAVPGFQFRSREDAEAFQSIARGETVDRSDEVAAGRESKVQSAAERLEAMAERMEASADESLNADRKTNTVKRAREANSAEQAARRQQAMAKTLKNLAAAMRSGNVTHLDGITNATQVATLRQQALRAKDASERAKNLSYQRREELKDVEPTAEQMGDAEYPYPFVHKSDVLKLVELGRNTPGAKLLAERLSKLTLPLDGGEMGRIVHPEMIETFRELSKKVTERGRPMWETFSWKFDDYDRLQRMGIRDLPALRAALREFVQYQGDTPKADPIKEKERALVGKKWEGFFPTPAPIVERMIAEAGIEDGMTVLEPSAGKGDIADAVRDAGGMVDAVEIVGELRDLLEAKGHNVIGRDIMDIKPRGFTYGDTFQAPDGKIGIMRGHPGGPHGGRVRLDDENGKTIGYYSRAELKEVEKNGINSGYDRVLMNPPFEDGKDIDHVMHAFALLRPGGKLIAVMGEGAFSRSDKKATAFREWLNEHGGVGEKLPSGSFSGSDAFRQTGTSTRLVVISKAEEVENNEANDGGVKLAADLPRQTAQIEEEREAILNPDDPNPLKGRSGGQDVRDVFAKVFKGRKDLLDRYAPGAADVITDAEIDASRYRGAMREMMDNLIGELDAVFGETKEGKKKRKAFVAELLPRAARLNPVAYDSNDNFVFADFNMRAGSISQKQAENAGVSTGSAWIGRDGEKLIVGEYLEDLKAYQLLRPMSAALQAALYEDFNRKYPETAHYLERFIAPDMADARITDSRGFELPEFNRHALRKFFGDVSPFGELGNVEGYVPEVSRTRSLAGIAMAAVRNALNKNWKSGAREYKTGDARESGEVRDIFAGFGLRALEAAAERERRDTAERLLAIAVKDIPPGGVVPDGWIAVNPQNLSHLANAYASAHGLDGKKLMEFTKAVAAGDMAALKTLVGQAWALLKTNKMIKAEVVKELVRPLTDRVIRNKFVALVDSLSKSYIGGLLAHPFSWITNMTSNELFKLMRIAQRALYGGFIKAAGLVSKDMARDPIQRGGKVALMEAWELTKGLLYARKWNQKQIDSVVSPELFEGNTSISGAVRSMTEDQMTAMDFLKQANVPQAILKAVNYSGMDVKAKQAIAYASYMAQAQVAADEAMKKGIKFADKAQRMEWMKNWLTKAPAEVHRRAHATAVAYAMDYENVPWWMDEKSATPAMNIVRRLMFPFIKWPYNMARQMKRFGLDSAIDLAAWTAGRTIGQAPGKVGEAMRAWQSSRKASGAKMANSVAHLATFGMMYAAMRALLGAAKDDDEVERLGRSFDQAGNRLGREWDTSNRINITDVPILGTAVAALAKMHGDTGENDYWLRVRNVPYAGPMLAMASTMSWLTAGADTSEGRADEAKNAWREFVSDFWSEGILLSSMNAIHGNESKYTAGQPVSATLGGAFMDLATSRIAPVPVLAAIRDTVDPQMRRLNDSKTLEYAPGFIEGMESRIPGLSDNLPPKGQVKTKLAANAVKDLAKVEHPKAKRIYTNPTTGKTMATYVDPEDKREIPRWRTLLRIVGANVKPVNRAGYKTAVAGKEQAAAYRKAMRVLNDD